MLIKWLQPLPVSSSRISWNPRSLRSKVTEVTEVPHETAHPSCRRLSWHCPSEAIGWQMHRQHGTSNAFIIRPARYLFQSMSKEGWKEAESRQHCSLGKHGPAGVAGRVPLWLARRRLASLRPAEGYQPPLAARPSLAPAAEPSHRAASCTPEACNNSAST
jgi:hypothetical protein